MVQCPLERDVYTILWMLSRRQLEAHQRLLRARTQAYIEIPCRRRRALYGRNRSRILRAKYSDIELLHHTSFRVHHIQYTVVQIFIEEASDAVILRELRCAGGFARICGGAVYYALHIHGSGLKYHRYLCFVFFEFYLQ